MLSPLNIQVIVPNDEVWVRQPKPPNVPLLRAVRSLLDSIWGVLKGSWGVLKGSWGVRQNPVV